MFIRMVIVVISYEYGYKTKDSNLEINIWIIFMTLDGQQLFDQDIKVLNDSNLNISSQLIKLTMLNNQNGAYFMVLHHSENNENIIGNIYYI